MEVCKYLLLIIPRMLSQPPCTSSTLRLAGRRVGPARPGACTGCARLPGLHTWVPASHCPKRAPPNLERARRRDELRAAWAAFTPLLHAIDRGEVTPLPYPAGTRGPPASDVLVSRAGFVKNKARSLLLLILFLLDRRPSPVLRGPLWPALSALGAQVWCRCPK